MIDLFTLDDVLSFSNCGIYRHSDIWLNFDVQKARKGGGGGRFFLSIF